MPFCLQSYLISSWHRFNKVLNHSSEILVEVMVSHSYCRFASCIWCETLHPHTKVGLSDWDLLDVEAIWVQWAHYHVVMIWALRHGALSCNHIWRSVHWALQGMDIVSNNAQLGCVKWSLFGTKEYKVCQESIPHSYTTSLNHWYKAEWILS